MLLVCFAVLVALLFRQAPAPPFAAFMPIELWVPGFDEIAAARVWVFSIFFGYVALGVAGWLRDSRLLYLSVPFIIVASFLIAFSRFAAGLRAFSP